MNWPRLFFKACPKCGRNLKETQLKTGPGYECRQKDHIFQITKERFKSLKIDLTQ